MRGRYDRLGLHHDEEDPRLIVPKRIRALGWTLNMEHRFGPVSLLAIFLIPTGIILASVFNR